MFGSSAIFDDSNEIDHFHIFKISLLFNSSQLRFDEVTHFLLCYWWLVELPS